MATIYALPDQPALWTDAAGPFLTRPEDGPFNLYAHIHASTLSVTGGWRPGSCSTHPQHWGQCGVYGTRYTVYRGHLKVAKRLCKILRPSGRNVDGSSVGSRVRGGYSSAQSRPIGSLQPRSAKRHGGQATRLAKSQATGAFVMAAQAPGTRGGAKRRASRT